MCHVAQVAWSPMWAVEAHGSSGQGGQQPARYAMLSVGTKSGRVWLFRYRLPGAYSMWGRGSANFVAESFALVRAAPCTRWC